jgi:hypothetical protein
VHRRCEENLASSGQARPGFEAIKDLKDRLEPPVAPPEQDPPVNPNSVQQEEEELNASEGEEQVQERQDRLVQAFAYPVAVAYPVVAHDLHEQNTGRGDGSEAREGQQEEMGEAEGEEAGEGVRNEAPPVKLPHPTEEAMRTFLTMDGMNLYFKPYQKMLDDDMELVDTTYDESFHIVDTGET